jgi:hypothetical protein
LKNLFEYRCLQIFDNAKHSSSQLPANRSFGSGSCRQEEKGILPLDRANCGPVFEAGSAI